MYPGATTRSGCCVASVDEAGTGPSMYRPGAPRSGFANPSTVYPKADHGAARSSFEDTEPETSFAPTVMMKGSFPGA